MSESQEEARPDTIFNVKPVRFLRRFRLKKDLVLAGAKLDLEGELNLLMREACVALVEIGPNHTGYLLIDLSSVLESPEIFEEVLRTPPGKPFLFSAGLGS